MRRLEEYEAPGGASFSLYPAALEVVTLFPGLAYGKALLRVRPVLGYVAEELGFVKRGQEDGAAVLFAGERGALGVAVYVVDLAAVFFNQGGDHLVRELHEPAEGEARAEVAHGALCKRAEPVCRAAGQGRGQGPPGRAPRPRR